MYAIRSYYGLRASVGGSVSFRAGLDRGAFADRAGNAGSDGVFLARESDVPFCAMVRAAVSGGRVSARGGFLTVEGADEAVLYVDIRTGFREADPYSACVANLVITSYSIHYTKLYDPLLRLRGRGFPGFGTLPLPCRQRFLGPGFAVAPGSPGPARNRSRTESRRRPSYNFV